MTRSRWMRLPECRCGERAGASARQSGVLTLQDRHKNAGRPPPAQANRWETLVHTAPPGNGTPARRAVRRSTPFPARDRCSHSRVLLFTTDAGVGRRVSAACIPFPLLLALRLLGCRSNGSESDAQSGLDASEAMPAGTGRDPAWVIRRSARCGVLEDTRPRTSATATAAR